MKIVVNGKTYEVHKESYGRCKKCGTSWDSWRIAEGFTCPNCETPLTKLGHSQIKQMLSDCIEAGCLQEEYAYSVPLMPKET